MMLLKFIEKYPKGYIPDTFRLNKGHMSFFRDKAIYLFKRLVYIQDEMEKRGFIVNYRWSMAMKSLNIPIDNQLDYDPCDRDSKIVAERLIDRILNPKRKKDSHSYYKEKICEEEFLHNYDKYLVMSND